MTGITEYRSNNPQYEEALSRTEFAVMVVKGTVWFVFVAALIYTIAQVVIYAFSGSVASTIEYGGYSIYPVKQLVAFYPNAFTEFIAKFGIF